MLWHKGPSSNSLISQPTYSLNFRCRKLQKNNCSLKMNVWKVVHWYKKVKKLINYLVNIEYSIFTYWSSGIKFSLPNKWIFTKELVKFTNYSCQWSTCPIFTFREYYIQHLRKSHIYRSPLSECHFAKSFFKLISFNPVQRKIFLWNIFFNRKLTVFTVALRYTRHVGCLLFEIVIFITAETKYHIISQFATKIIKFN